MRLLVGTRKGLFTLVKGSGGAWEITKVDFLAAPVTAILPDSRDGALYVGLNHGHFGVKMHRSDDGGTQWKEIATPVYPPKPDDLLEPPGMMGSQPDWKLIQVWALEAGGRSESGLIWAGTLPGGLFISRDRGDSWELVRSLWNREERYKWFGGGADSPGIHSICVDPRDSKRVTLGISCGGVWATDDGGQSWECRADGMWANYMPPEMKDDPNIQDPHRIVQCPSNPDVMWAQHHNGVFRTTDNAKSWHEITNVTPSNFGFAVAVHPEDADTAWFVPAVKDETRVPVDAEVVVARTRDGGETFQELRNGLPQKDAYDLVFRHCLDIARDGSTLAFGSTTGGLWVTENQGDTWQCINAHLPPVYVVRFAE
jgi:hypothetical protein